MHPSAQKVADAEHPSLSLPLNPKSWFGLAAG